MNRLTMGLGAIVVAAAALFAAHRPLRAATPIPAGSVAAAIPAPIIEEEGPAPRWGFTDAGSHRALDIPMLGSDQRAMIRRFVEVRERRLARVPADCERLSDAFESAIVSLLTPQQLAIYRELLRRGVASLEMYHC